MIDNFLHQPRIYLGAFVGALFGIFVAWLLHLLQVSSSPFVGAFTVAVALSVGVWLGSAYESESRLNQERERLRELERSHARRARDERQVADLHITVVAEPGALPDIYRLEVTNLGVRDFRSLTIDDRDLLLWAERFSLDTTHMPSDQHYAAGEPIKIDYLAAGETAVVLRQGYGHHDRYDGARDTEVRIFYTVDDQVVSLADNRWCRVRVNLAGAR